MERPTLYFDFLSPYSFLLWQRIKKSGKVDLFRYAPVVLAKLFQHWGQRYIADIKPKREAMFKNCLRIAASEGIELQAPLQHPFNSLYALRLATESATGQQPEQQKLVIDQLWQMTWQQRLDMGNPDVIKAELENRGVQAVDQLFENIFTPAVKSELKKNFTEAIENDVFGVPTIRYKNENFWGQDSWQFFINFYQGQDNLDHEKFQRIKESLDG